MSAWNSNSAYVEVDGIDISAYWAGEINPSGSNDLQEITAGSGVAHKQYADGLNDGELALMIVADASNFNTYKSIFQLGKRMLLEFGPKGAVTGYPVFEGYVRVSKVTGRRSPSTRR